MAVLEEVAAAPSNPAATLSVPLYLCREIFLRLPAKSLIRFRSVCKAYRAVIDDPCFVKAHTNNNQLSSNAIILRTFTGPPFYPFYYLGLEALKFTNGHHTIPVTPLDFTRDELSRLRTPYEFPVAECNGLLLVRPVIYGDKIWEIWNPLTHERLELPKGNSISENVPVIRLGYGLGYDCVADDYKAVVIDPTSTEDCGTNVYSLKSDSWRRISSCDLSGDLKGLRGPGVPLSGALHWITECKKLIVLDLETEKYRQLAMPFQREPVSKPHLNVLGGCLILSHGCKLDVWVMKDYGDEDSWAKLFSISDDGQLYFRIDSLRPVAYVKNNMQILLINSFGFYLFDGESNCLKNVYIHGPSGELCAQVIHGSLYQLHDNCGVSGGDTKRRRIKRRKRKSKMKMKMCDTELTFCVRDAPVHTCAHLWFPEGLHDSCYFSSGEDEED